MSPAGPALWVDEAAITDNARRLKGSHDLLAVVKADGFGLGGRTVAEAAARAGARMLAVTTVAEARAVVGLGLPVLSWLNPWGTDHTDPRTREVHLAVSSTTQLAEVVAAAVQVRERRAVHLFVDTGMSRDGCPREEWPALCTDALAAESAGAVRVVGVMGHLGCPDPHDPEHARAVRRFDRAVALARHTGLRPDLVHLAATAAALDAPHARYDAVRVGAGLVGIDPTGRSRLTPTATLTAPVVQVRQLRAGDLVGYGHDTRVLRSTQVALVPLGYADGLPRAASGRAQVWVAGRRRPVLGLVSMDQVVVELGRDPVPVGTEVTVFGPGTHGEPTVAEWARWSGTIEHEILTGVGARVPRCSRADRTSGTTDRLPGRVA